MNTSVLGAIFRRNFVAYFSSATGYLFIAFFMLASAAAAFYPAEFFNANLANLDQLNKSMPFILLFFIPAITMGIWADERRQGTDELLLTIPAGDVEVVLGKYLAAISIYSVALLLSLLTSLFMLLRMGEPDLGLLFANGVGYWLMGVAMLAIGMVGSFLTSNLTVAFIVGLALNFPLVIISQADEIVANQTLVGNIKHWSLMGRFDDFGRGTLSLSSTLYFLLIAASMVYLCVVLIGRRHWLGGRDGNGMLGHYIVRGLALAVISFCAIVVFSNRFDVRPDATSARLNSLSPSTVKLLQKLHVDELADLDKQRADLDKELAAKKAQAAAAAVPPQAPNPFRTVSMQTEAVKDAKPGDALAADKPETPKAADKPATDKPADVPAAPTPDKDKAAAEKPAKDKPAGDEPAAGKPAADQPAKPAEPKKDPKVEAKKEAEKLQQRLRQLDLDKKRLEAPVVVDAYVSRDVPEQFAAKKLEVLSRLQEMKSDAGGKLVVNVYEIDPASKIAQSLKDRHGIEARKVNSETRGQFSTSDIYLGASVRSGLNEVVIEFFELGIPAEYDLIQAIVSVSQTKRKTLGVVKTDADLMGGRFDFSGGMPSSSQQQPLIRELKKHYNVVEVDPTEKVVDAESSDKSKYDVLIVVQPSSLSPPQLKNLMDAVRAGIPTAIFEDPYPFAMRNVPGTDQPKRPQQNMMMMGMQQPPQEKGEISALFELLGVRFVSQRFDDNKENPAMLGLGGGKPESVIIGQRYNPYPTLRFLENLTSQWVFVNGGAPGAGASTFADDPVTRGLYELLYLFPGGILESPSKPASLKFTPLVTTGDKTTTVRYADADEANSSQLGFSIREKETEKTSRYCLAARIEGKPAAPARLAAKDAKQPASDKPVNVILVSDIDMLDRWFFALRARPEQGLNLQFQNVPFVLNIVDSLAGDDRFLEIRKGRPAYGRLTKVEADVSDRVTTLIESKIDKAEETYKDVGVKAEAERKAAEKDAQSTVEKLKEEGKLSVSELKAAEDSMNIRMKRASEKEELQKAQALIQLRKERDEAIEDGKRETYALNDRYKAQATWFPPILPAVVGLIVYLYRKSREHEGVAKSRLRS